MSNEVDRFERVIAPYRGRSPVYTEVTYETPEMRAERLAKEERVKLFRCSNCIKPYHCTCQGRRVAVNPMDPYLDGIHAETGRLLDPIEHPAARVALSSFPNAVTIHRLCGACRRGSDG